MAAAAGILNHSTSAADLTGTTVKADADTDTSSTSTTITSSDFLTLLVTELKNQDPTASTDPNEYVNQLVAINSLEQLININSTLTDSLDTTTTTSSVATAAASDSTSGSNATLSNASGSGSSIASALHTATSKLAPGNLSVPAANASAQTVAEALNGRHKAL